MSEDSQVQLGELSAEVFEKFLTAIEQAGIPEEVRARLREILLVNPKFTDAALRTAVFGEESPQ